MVRKLLCLFGELVFLTFYYAVLIRLHFHEPSTVHGAALNMYSSDYFGSFVLDTLGLIFEY